MSTHLPVGHLVDVYLRPSAAARLEVDDTAATVTVIAEHPDGWTVERHAGQPEQLAPGDVLAWIDLGTLPADPDQLARFRAANLPTRTVRPQGDLL